MRLMSDAYGKGIVRGQMECTSRRARCRNHGVMFAESFRTCQNESFFGREYVSIVERMNDHVREERRVVFGEVDARNSKKKRAIFRDVALLYWQRHCDPEVSEFVMYWELVLLVYPLHPEDICSLEFHANLT